MIQGAHAGQTKLVHVPVEGDNRLLGDHLVIEELDSACHSHGDAILILQHSIGRVVILVDVQSAIATKGREEITVLREVADAPNCRFMCDLC